MIQLWQLGAPRGLPHRNWVVNDMRDSKVRYETKNPPEMQHNGNTNKLSQTSTKYPSYLTYLSYLATLLHPCCTTFRVSIVRRVGLSHNSCYIFNILSLGFFVPFFVIMRKWKQTHNARDPHRLCWSLWLSVSWYRFSWARMSTPVHPVGSRAKNVNSYVRKWVEKGQHSWRGSWPPAQRSREPKTQANVMKFRFMFAAFVRLHVMVIIHSYPPTHRWVCEYVCVCALQFACFIS